MNWKINYWTLMCFIILGGLVYYSCKSKNSSSKNNVTANLWNCKDPYNIAVGKAKFRIQQYRNLMGKVKEAADETKDTSIINNLPINLDTGYLALPVCELTKMIKDSQPKDTVYIFLTLEDVPKDASSADQGKKMMSAVLSVKPTEIFYDFITPCPPYCKD